MNAAYKVLYALAVWPVALILAVIGAWWPLALVLACGLFEWLGVPERVGAWLGGDRRGCGFGWRWPRRSDYWRSCCGSVAPPWQSWPCWWPAGAGMARLGSGASYERQTELGPA